MIGRKRKFEEINPTNETFSNIRCYEYDILNTLIDTMMPEYMNLILENKEIANYSNSNYFIVNRITNHPSYRHIITYNGIIKTLDDYTFLIFTECIKRILPETEAFLEYVCPSHACFSFY